MQYDSYKAQFKHLAAAQCEFLDSESFQIHMPEFDVRNIVESFESNKKTTRPEEQTMETSHVEEAKEQDNQEDDFEFYNVNEDE